MTRDDLPGRAEPYGDRPRPGGQLAELGMKLPFPVDISTGHPQHLDRAGRTVRDHRPDVLLGRTRSDIDRRGKTHASVRCMETLQLPLTADLAGCVHGGDVVRIDAHAAGIVGLVAAGVDRATGLGEGDLL